jgi:hypothetical protein
MPLNKIDRDSVVYALDKAGGSSNLNPYEIVNKDGVRDCLCIDFENFAQVARFFTQMGREAGYVLGTGETYNYEDEKAQGLADDASLEYTPEKLTVYFKGWTLY